MQDWDGCDTLSTGEGICLKDTRNEQYYRVRKMPDGKCWMIDNLKLASVLLTSSDTNLINPITLPGAATSGPSDFDTVDIWDPGSQTYCSTAGDGLTGYWPNSKTGCGYLYNWHAATAKVGVQATAVGTTITESICPKGWTLPADGGYGTLHMTLGGTYTSWLTCSSGSTCGGLQRGGCTSFQAPYSGY